MRRHDQFVERDDATVVQRRSRRRADAVGLVAHQAYEADASREMARPKYEDSARRQDSKL